VLKKVSFILSSGVKRKEATFLLLKRDPGERRLTKEKVVPRKVAGDLPRCIYLIEQKRIRKRIPHSLEKKEKNDLREKKSTVLRREKGADFK